MNARFVVLWAGLASSAACVPTDSTTVSRAATAADSANQVMFGVQFFVTDGGLKRAEVKSDTAYMYEENTRTELRTVHSTFFTNTGEKNAVLTSIEGTYSSRLGNMEARGNVVVVSTDGRRLTSPQLRFDPGRNEIASDSTFVMTEKDGRTISGIGFVSDPDLNNVRVLRAFKSTGNKLTLPRR